MPRPVITYRVRCAMCGTEFEAKRANAMTCSTNCRKAKSDEAKRARAIVARHDAGTSQRVTVAATPPPPADPEPSEPDEPPADGVYAATLAALPDGIPAWERANVLAVAKRLDNTRMDTASAVATLSKRFEELMRRLVPETDAADDGLAAILGGAA